MNLRVVFILVAVITYLIYTLTVYFNCTKIGLSTFSESKDYIRGKLLWQKKNCTACHQIYGLGGYMGPDLTNVISQKNKGEVYVESVLKSGIGIMPDFKLTDEDRQDIIAYLRAIDASGISNKKDFTITWLGTVE